MRGNSRRRSITLICCCAIGVVLLAVFIGYRNKLPVGEVIGSYTLTYEVEKEWLGTETLVIRDDGSFEQQFRIPGGRVYLTTGKWSYDQQRSAINFYGLMLVVDEWGRKLREKPKTTNFFTQVHSWWGTEYITVDDDLGLRYAKSRKGNGSKGEIPVPVIAIPSASQ